MKNYECRECGCTLDPGEGILCDDCRKRLEQRKGPIDAPTSIGHTQPKLCGKIQIHNSISLAGRSNYEY